jgi:hypothetical protein
MALSGMLSWHSTSDSTSHDPAAWKGASPFGEIYVHVARRDSIQAFIPQSFRQMATCIGFEVEWPNKEAAVPLRLSDAFGRKVALRQDLAITS